MKVYLATSGEYSDYRIMHVFARREDAENYPLADAVEERWVHDEPIEVRRWHMLTWSPHLGDRRGDSNHLPNPYEYSSLRDFDGGQPAGHQWVCMQNGDLVTDQLRIEGWDLQRIRKVYSEQRAQYLARQH